MPVVPQWPMGDTGRVGEGVALLDVLELLGVMGTDLRPDVESRKVVYAVVVVCGAIELDVLLSGPVGMLDGIDAPPA